MASLFSFIFLGLAFLSIWVRRDSKIWMGLFFLSVIAAILGGNVLPIGALILFVWALLWFGFAESKSLNRIFIFSVLVLASFPVVFHLVPGFNPITVTQKFRIGMQKSAVLGLFPLALFVPVAVNGSDWKKVCKGFLFGCLGIAIMALLATAVGVTRWQMKLPPSPWIVYLDNLFFVAIPEEAFYRGFIQSQFSQYLKNKYAALFLASIIFTVAHVYWSPNGMTLAFVFIASLLYGGVYLLSGKIESAILTHFLLNFIHITFFTYHAL